VRGDEKLPRIQYTEFLENRTGVPGFLRRWKGRAFFTQNTLTSSRGEESKFLSGPGLELAYSSDFWALEPFLFFDSGLFHPDSKLSVSERQFGIARNLKWMPKWSYLFGSVHQYQLSGQNPGSSRLGAVDSLALGLGGIQRIGKHYLQGRAAFLYSTEPGFDARLEYGQVWNRRSDFHLTWGFFLGSSRYSGVVTIASNRTTQSLFEDRFIAGISIGFLGPESSREITESQSP
jgi:hypothetical protein